MPVNVVIMALEIIFCDDFALPTRPGHFNFANKKKPGKNQKQPNTVVRIDE